MNQAPIRPGMKLFVTMFLLFVISMLTWFEATKNALVWDSVQYLFRYEQQISSLDFDHLSWMFSALEFYNWHPLTWLSWAVDYQLYGGIHPWGFHFSNNVFHAINSVLVFVLALVCFRLVDPSSKDGFLSTDNQSLLAAFLAAVIFIVHPQHVESIVWVAERKDLLCLLFMLLTLLAYVKYTSCGESGKARWYLVTLGSFLLAVLSKPMAVTMPAILLLADVYPLRRTALLKPLMSSIKQASLSRLVLEKIPFILLSGLLVVLTLKAQQGAINNQMSFDLRLLNAFNSTVFYLEKLVVPVQFSPFYPYLVAPGQSISWHDFIPVLVFAGIFVAVLVAWGKDRRAWLVAWLFYLLTLAPVLGIIQVGEQGAADRYAYFPTLPVYLLLGAGILMLLKKSGHTGRALIVLITIPVAVLLATTTRHQIHAWQDEVSLWTHAAKYTPRSSYIRDNLGIAYINLGDYENAVIQLELSEQLPSKPTTMLAFRSLAYMRLERYEEAMVDLLDLGSVNDTVPALKADENCIQYDIAWNYARLGMLPEAGELFGRVEPGSVSGPDAQTWLEWLADVPVQMEKTLPDQALPGACVTLIPSLMRDASLR